MTKEFGIIDYQKDKELLAKGVRFLPMVGNAYEKGISYSPNGELLLNDNAENSKKVKLLVLGESHYIEDYEDGDDISRFTRCVVGDYCAANSYSQRWMNTFTKFARALAGKETNVDENRAIWDSLIFYNFLQVPLYGPRVQGNAEDYEDSQSPLFTVLEMYHPTLVLVWGYRLWNFLPSDHSFTWEPNFSINENEHKWGKYTLSDGKEVKVLPIYHPSVGFSWDYWNLVIRKGIEYEQL